MPDILISELAQKLFKGEYKELHIDSRLVKKGDIFLAMPGANTHGNCFAESVLAKGAGLVLVERKVEHKKGKKIIAVDQPKKFLWRLAKAMVKLSSAKRIGITGSNGKTTTKDLTALALGGEGRKVLKTRGNFNNQLGVPLTLCRLKHHHKLAVIEMGTSEVGEIEILTKLVKPDLGVLTAINAAHMDGLKKLTVVAQEKTSLFRGLKAGSPCIFREKEFKFGAVKSSTKDKQVQYFDLDREASNLKFSKGKMTWKFKNVAFSLSTPAIHNVENAQAAILVALAMGEPIATISKRLAAWTPSNHRMCILNWRKRTLIDDCYNANPASMLAAVQSALNLKQRREQKVLLAMADMKEMGTRSGKVHGDLGKDLAELGIDVLLTMGKDAFKTMSSFDRAGGEASKHCESTEEMGSLLQSLSRPHDIVLVKGSRGMHLEEVIDQFSSQLKEPVKA